MRQEVKDLPVRKEFLAQQVLKDLEVHAEKLVLQELLVLKELLVLPAQPALPERRRLFLDLRVQQDLLVLRAQLEQLGTRAQQVRQVLKEFVALLALLGHKEI